MKLFSQRKGIKPVKSVMQVDSMDDDLRIGLWNALTLIYWNNIERTGNYHNIRSLYIRLWHDYFKKPIYPLNPSSSYWREYWREIYKEIKKYFSNCEWFEVYDFIEFIANNYPINKDVNSEFMKFCNSVLEREASAYRFVGGKITQITTEEEISEIEEALKTSNPLKGVHAHLKRALDLLADRKSPDYRNSIKESISAVEAICNLIAGEEKSTLGQALKKIEDKVGLHPALKNAFSSLYGYTSDAEGIRHALLDEPKLSFEDAKFMLVSCSAFINYLIGKSSKVGIKI